MKQLLLAIALVLFSNIISNAQNEKFKLYIYTSQYSGACIKFTKDLSNNEQLKEVINNYDVIMVNKDAITSPNDKYAKYVGLYNDKKEYPFFVVENKDNMLQQFVGGYSSADSLIKYLDISYVKRLQPMKLAEVFVERNKKYIRNENKTLMYKLFFKYQWKGGVSVAINGSNVPLGCKEYKIGYQAGISLYRRYYKSGTSITSGLLFNSIGAKDARLNYLKVPLEFGFDANRITKYLPISLSLGGYGAYKIGGVKTAEKFDYGINARIFKTFGSFIFWVGYQRGFVKITPLNGYNNGFSLGMNMYLGI